MGLLISHHISTSFWQCDLTERRFLGWQLSSNVVEVQSKADSQLWQGELRKYSLSETLVRH